MRHYSSRNKADYCQPLTIEKILLLDYSELILQRKTKGAVYSVVIQCKYHSGFPLQLLCGAELVYAHKTGPGALVVFTGIYLD